MKNKSINQNETLKGNELLRQCRTLLWFHWVSSKLTKFNITPPALTGGTFKRQQSQESQSQPTRVDYRCHSQPTRGDYRGHGASVPTGLALSLQDDAPRRSSKVLAWESFVYYKLSSTVCSVTAVQK